MVEKEYDLIVHGATGFTGQLICEYLYSHDDSKLIKWAISGRNISKLTPISKKYKIDLFEVDSFKMGSLDLITSKAKVIISVVGPYAIYGKQLVESCVKNNCHYLDITGESSFVQYVKDNYSQRAIDSNIILINCCGFESIPPDIGTYYSIKQLNEENIDVKCYMKTKGQISGGTWASFLNHFNAKKIKNKIKNNSSKKEKNKILFYNKELKKWALIFPDIDQYIIRHSSKLIQGYGKNVKFVKYMLFKSLFRVTALLIPLFFISILARFKASKKWLESFIPSGTGPSKEDREKHWFEYILIGKTKTQKIITKVKGGDPGYGETSKFVAEMGLSLILDRNQLIHKKGVLTPAACAGDVILKRLQKSGIQFSHKKVKV
tara:strand:- start:2341 stop:3471 length:1131 start_codon:yes stop_codon:yes gene_type:complete